MELPDWTGQSDGCVNILLSNNFCNQNPPVWRVLSLWGQISSPAIASVDLTSCARVLFGPECTCRFQRDHMSYLFK
jgi:hypothetical protein